MKSLFALVSVLFLSTAAYAQDPVEPVEDDEPENVTLVLSPEGLLVRGNPDGTTAEEGFIVPELHELMVLDIVWFILGDPGVDARIGMVNTNIDGVSDYIMWQATPTLNASGQASGTTSFREGPVIRTEGGVSFFGTHPFNLTIYGTLRELPPPDPEMELP